MPLSRLHTVETTPQTTAWKLHAACSTDTADLFYSTDHGDAREAMAYCRDCTVQDACLAYALDAEDGRSSYYRYGIWGGTTPHERAALARRNRRRTHTPPTLPTPRPGHRDRDRDRTETS